MSTLDKNNKPKNKGGAFNLILTTSYSYVWGMCRQELHYHPVPVAAFKLFYTMPYNLFGILKFPVKLSCNFLRLHTFSFSHSTVLNQVNYSHTADWKRVLHTVQALCQNVPIIHFCKCLSEKNCSNIARFLTIILRFLLKCGQQLSHTI